MRNNTSQKINRTVLVISILSTVLVSGALLAIFWFSAEQFRYSVFGFLQNCVQILMTGSVLKPTSIAILTVSVITLIGLIKMMFFAIRSFVASACFLSKLQLKRSLWKKEDGISIYEFNDSDSVAFTFGLIRPSIYVSSGMRNSFTYDELCAVVAHEKYHVLQLHPFQRFVVDLLQKGLFFLPVLKEYRKYHYTLCEIEADKYAVEKTSITSLARSMLRSSQNSLARPMIIASGFSQVPVRIQVLIQNKSFRLTFSLRAIAVSLVVVLAFILTLQPSQPLVAASAPISDHCNSPTYEFTSPYQDYTPRHPQQPLYTLQSVVYTPFN